MVLSPKGRGIKNLDYLSLDLSMQRSYYPSVISIHTDYWSRVTSLSVVSEAEGPPSH